MSSTSSAAAAAAAATAEPPPGYGAVRNASPPASPPSPPAAGEGALTVTAPSATPSRTLVMFMLRLSIFQRTHFVLFAFIALMAIAMCITPLCVYLLISEPSVQTWFVTHVNQLQSAELYLLVLFAAAFVPGMANLMSALLRVDTVYVVVIALFAGALDLAYNTCRNVALFLALIKPTADGFMPVPDDQVPVPDDQVPLLRGQIGEGPNSITLITIVLIAIYMLFFAAQHLMHAVYYDSIRNALRTGRHLTRYVDTSGEILV